MQVVSSTELKFTLDAESMKQPGRFDLVVMNPAPADTFFTRGMWGNGTSNLAHIVVNYRSITEVSLTRRRRSVKLRAL